MKKAFLLMTFVLAFVIAMMPVTYAAPEDGTWVATNDSNGEDIITFIVSGGGTKVKVYYYSTLYHCPKGGDKQWGHYTDFLGDVDIDSDDKFEWLDGMKNSNKPAAGAGVAAVITGQFSDTTGTGTLQGWYATFKGRKFKTQVCETDEIEWTAEKSPSSLLPAETDGPLMRFEVEERP
jgi:hypothetical protein